MLSVATAQSTSDGNAICYVLPDMWLTSCFHIIERIGENQGLRVCFVEFVRWRHQREICRLRLHLVGAGVSYADTSWNHVIIQRTRYCKIERLLWVNLSHIHCCHKTYAEWGFPGSEFFKKAEDTSTRGHAWKLVKKHSRCDTRLYFFTQRVINRWNNLSQEDVDAQSINCFKSRLKKKRARQMDFFKDL